jgi:hypothetical protein
MTHPEWTTLEQGLRSRRTAQRSMAAVLIGLAVLGGIGLGIPIGREQQARVDAQRGRETRPWQDEQSGNFEQLRGWLSAQDGGVGTGTLPPLPDVATQPADLQRAFNQFHCAATDGTPSMQCEALAVLQADSRFEPGSASAPALMPGSANGTYRAGQEITLAAKASAEFDGYLYVDYFDLDGNVYHMRPGSQSEVDPLKAAAWIELGGRPGARYTACPPFGIDLAVAISLPQPIFGRERPLEEPAARYLADLHERLQEVAGESGARPVSRYTAVVTFPRGSTEL